MREEFGLDTLAEHALEDVAEDEVVVNPLWRYLDNAVTKSSRRWVYDIRVIFRVEGH